MGIVNHRVRSAIAEEALEWFVRNRGGMLSHNDRPAFSAWLKSSPLHVEEYLRIAALSQNVRAAISTMDIDLARLVSEARGADHREVIPLGLFRGHSPRSVGASWRARPGPVAAVAAAVAVICAGVILARHDRMVPGLQSEFATARGEQRFWRLPDGSGMDLNADSAVVVRFDRHERVVKIERGEALFQVAHEGARRFRVVAGATDVIAVGTEFEVLQQPGSTLVTVVQGKVTVVADTPVLAVAPAGAAPQGLFVKAGEQVQVDDHADLSKLSVVAANVPQEVAWVQRKITFDEQPLGTVAAQFSRDHGIPIFVQGSRLRDLPISGVFNEYDMDSFLAFIGRLDNVEVERTDDHILVREKAAP
jgi:transmembrane sensor